MMKQNLSYPRATGRGLVKKLKVFYFFFTFLKLEHLSKRDYFRDILGIVNIAGPARNRRLVAHDVLTDLATTYRKTAQPLIAAKKNRLLKELEFIEFID